MQFRLIYQGKLPSAGRKNTRVKDKHKIRKVFHPQLVQLWNCQPVLSRYLSPVLPMDKETVVDRMAHNHKLGEFNFMPLLDIEQFGNLACSLDILFLRRNQPGDIIKSGGDIDNRIKVLFDALRIPDNTEELAGFQPDDDEDPFFCLLQNDSQITGVNINTDRLLTPKADGEGKDDVHLIIHVKTLSLDGNAFTAFMI